MMNDKASAAGQPGVQRVLQSKGETRSYYNKIARFYDLLAERSEQPMRDAGLAMLAAVPGERVLEIGFGTGHCVVALAQAVGPTGHVFGIDLSDKMVELAQQLVEEKQLADRVELGRGDAADLPYEDHSLNAIFMSFTLELFDTPEIPKVLRECHRVLVPEGRLVVVAISKEGKDGLVMHLYEWTHRHFPNLLDCRPIYVQPALDAAGFRVVDRVVESMWVPVEIVKGVPAK